MLSLLSWKCGGMTVRDAYLSAAEGFAVLLDRLPAGLWDTPALGVWNLRDLVGHATGAALSHVVAVLDRRACAEAWLPTRTFELVVHGLDIAAVTGISASFSADALADATALAARIAVATGDGATVLRALTGRGTLPERFSVV